MRKKWLVGFTLDGKTVIKEYHQGIDTHNLWASRVFEASNPETNSQVKSWLDVAKEQWCFRTNQKTL